MASVVKHESYKSHVRFDLLMVVKIRNVILNFTTIGSIAGW